MAAPIFSVIFTIVGSLLLLLPSPGSCQFGCQGVGFYPHPSDCSQFYRCTDIWSTGQYQQYVFTCAEGTVFDASIRNVKIWNKQKDSTKLSSFLKYSVWISLNFIKQSVSKSQWASWQMKDGCTVCKRCFSFYYLDSWFEILFWQTKFIHQMNSVLMKWENE